MTFPDSFAPAVGAPLDSPLDQLTLDELRRRTSVKWRAYPPDVLPLFVAEMDTAQAPFVVDAVTRALAAGDTGYDQGDLYAEAFAPFAERRWGWVPDVDTSRTMPDVMVAIVEVLRVLTAPGDSVVVTPPVYSPFYGFVRNEGRQIVEAPLTDAGRLDLSALEDAFARATGAVPHGAGPGSGRRAVLLLCNPQNPTGTAHTRSELEAVLALADRFGVRVLSDEIHAPFTGDRAPFVPVLAVPGSERAVAVHSASKAFNLAGLRAAVAVAGREAADDLRRIPEEASHAINHLAVVAHAAAYREGDAWLDALVAGVVRNRGLLERLVSEQLPTVRVHPADATYLAWLDFRGALPSDVDPHRFLIRNAKVALESGRDFGTGGAGFLRLNFATNQAILTDAIGRIAAALPR